MLNKMNKEEIIKSFRTSETDTGSAEVQIGLLTHRIKQINEHLSQFKKDKHSRHGLVKLVGKRRTLLKYLKRTNPGSFADISIRVGRDKKKAAA